jgi:hypothetical protein
MAWTRSKDGRSLEACNRAKQKYNERHYDQVKIYAPKGGREIIQQLAAATGMSMAEYIRHCIIADAQRRGIDVSAALGGGGAP